MAGRTSAVIDNTGGQFTSLTIIANAPTVFSSELRFANGDVFELDRVDGRRASYSATVRSKILLSDVTISPGGTHGIETGNAAGWVVWLNAEVEWLADPWPTWTRGDIPPCVLCGRFAVAYGGSYDRTFVPGRAALAVGESPNDGSKIEVVNMTAVPVKVSIREVAQKLKIG